MTDTQELDGLIAKAELRGATVNVAYDNDALVNEGRRIYRTIQVSGLTGVGPYPMSPISAAEALRLATAHE